MLTAVCPWVCNWAAPDVPLRVSPHLDPACEHRSFVSRSNHPRVSVTVQIKANGTIQVRTISLNVRFLQSAQDLVPRMPVDVPCSDGNDGKLRMYGSKQISSR